MAQGSHGKQDNEAGFLDVSPFTSIADRLRGHTPLVLLLLMFPLTCLKITCVMVVLPL